MRYTIIKYFSDKIFSFVLILLFIPFFIIIMVVIKSSSKGPVFHSAKRIGLKGVEFNKYKFRTMVPNGEKVLQNLLNNNPEIFEEYRKTYKIKNDPRVTEIGKILRKYSLDELPQLINILKGDMSLVGPRDILEQELMDHYNHCIEKFLSVKPGLTGLWQVSGRSRLSYKERVRLDLYYIENISLKLDLYILLKTVPTVIKGDGAV